MPRRLSRSRRRSSRRSSVSAVGAARRTRDCAGRCDRTATAQRADRRRTGTQMCRRRSTVQTVCADPGAAGAGAGWGRGRRVAVHHDGRFGPLAEVQAVWAAVNAEQAPDPSDPNYVEDVYNPGGIRRRRGGRAHLVPHPRHRRSRSSTRSPALDADAGRPLGHGRSRLGREPRAAGAGHRPVSAPCTPRSCAGCRPRCSRVGPADEDPDGWTYVQHRTFFWVDQGAGPVGDRVGQRRRAGGISVTVQAVPERLVVNPGDGSEAIVCVGRACRRSPRRRTARTSRAARSSYLRLVGDGAERGDVPGGGVDRLARHVVGVDGRGWRPRLPLDDLGRPRPGRAPRSKSVIVNAEPVTTVRRLHRRGVLGEPRARRVGVGGGARRDAVGRRRRARTRRTSGWRSPPCSRRCGRSAGDGPVVVVSDSTYVVNCFRDKWYVRWAGQRVAQRQEAAGRQRRPVAAAGRARRGRRRRRSAGSRATAATASTTSSTSSPSRGDPALTTDGHVDRRQVGMARSRSATMSSPSSRPIEIAHQAGRDADRRLLLGRQADVGARRRVADQRLGPAERRRRSGRRAGRRASCGRRRCRRRGRSPARSAGTSAGGRPARAAGGRAGRGSARRRRRDGGPALGARRRATSAWWRWRTASVRMPRSPLRASYGEALAPCSTA